MDRTRYWQEEALTFHDSYDIFFDLFLLCWSRSTTEIGEESIEFLALYVREVHPFACLTRCKKPTDPSQSLSSTDSGDEDVIVFFTTRDHALERLRIKGHQIGHNREILQSLLYSERIRLG